MKSTKAIYLTSLVLLVGGITLFSCKKDTTTVANGITGTQVAQLQNSDSQDAISDKTEQDVDNTADEVQNSAYQNQTSISKDALASSRTITVDHPDSTTFPKQITIVYNNWTDSTINETLVKNGEIDIYVTVSGTKYGLVTRAFTFKNFSVTTDSTTLSINGNRTVERTKDSLLVNLKKGIARLGVTDAITANLNYSITTTGSTDSLKFTRVVNRTRVATAWFAAIVKDKHLRVTHLASSDTATLTGEVTGSNEKNLPYDKKITTPLIIHGLRGIPVLTSGEIDYTGGTGTTAFSYTITYKQDLPLHPFMTLVTVTNVTTGKTHSFDRRFGRKFIRWW